MKVLVRGLGHLASEIGSIEIEIKDVECLEVEKLLEEVISKVNPIAKFITRNTSWDARPGYLVFLNKVDLRILVREKRTLCSDVIIDVVPVIHHG